MLRLEVIILQTDSCSSLF